MYFVKMLVGSHFLIVAAFLFSRFINLYYGSSLFLSLISCCILACCLLQNAQSRLTSYLCFSPLFVFLLSSSLFCPFSCSKSIPILFS